jgi:ssDNA thymidine ADP-ribosyltransferase, DarT
MTTPRRGLLFHFTHIDNLASVVTGGLWCDNAVTASSTPFVEVGERRIKDQRRTRRVPIGPGGVVADYVPFYFAARSPMLYSIHMNNVPTYARGQDGVVYLVTDTTTIAERGLPFVFTDRNAYYTVAHYSDDLASIDALVDWPLMEGRNFFKTEAEPDRPERRMAEFLVHQHVPWPTIRAIATRTDDRAREVASVFASLGAEPVPIRTRPGWYF